MPAAQSPRRKFAKGSANNIHQRLDCIHLIGPHPRSTCMTQIHMFKGQCERPRLGTNPHDLPRVVWPNWAKTTVSKQEVCKGFRQQYPSKMRLHTLHQPTSKIHLHDINPHDFTCSKVSVNVDRLEQIHMICPELFFHTGPKLPCPSRKFAKGSTNNIHQR